jgi:hypothetical protein
MSQKVSQHDHVRSPQDAARRDRRLAEAFKPLALPALAAAVQMSKSQKSARRPPSDDQVPAILRVEAFVD